jgi:hypothetical protein
MKHLRTLLPLAAILLCPACSGLDRPQPGYRPQAQWAPPGQWTPQGQPMGQPPLGQPVPPGPGQWVPPPQQQQGWWPQSALPGLGGLPLPVPAIPGVPGLPGGAAQQCVDGINQYRARSGLPALARWFPTEPCAASEAQSDAQAGQPHGSFGRCGEMGQNVCPGWQGPAEQMTGPCLQSMYNEGPGADFATHGHYVNMMSPRFTKVACGYFTTPQGQVWAVQDFQ